MTRGKLIGVLITLTALCFAISLFPSLKCFSPSPAIATQAGSSQVETINWEGPVPPDKVWSIRLNSPVDPLTVTTQNVVLLDSQENQIATQLRVERTGLRIIVRPLQPLPRGSYQLRVSDRVLDTAGHPLEKQLVINFAVAKNLDQSADGTGEEADYVDGAASSWVFGLMSDAPVDFAVSAEDIDIPRTVHPSAVYLTVRTKIHNRSPGTGLAGGSVLRVLLDDQVIDEVPFYLGAERRDALVSARCYLSPKYYKHLRGQEHATVRVTVVVDPYNRTPETDESNNVAVSSFEIYSDHDDEIENTNPPMTVDATGLSAWSSKDDAPNRIVNAALPGEILNLKAEIFRPAGDSEDLNIKFLLNGLVVLDDNRHVGSRRTDGFIEASAKYAVPYNARGPLHFQVVLSNGSTASIEVPVLQWDTEVREGDLYWTGSDVAVPGGRLYLKTTIKNTCLLGFYGSQDNKIACRILVNGKPYYERAYQVILDQIYVDAPPYEVPPDQTGPVTFTVVTDPYRQLPESDETNNVATIQIPVAAGGSEQPDLRVSPSGLTVIARPVIPGSRLLLSAAVYNASKNFPPRSVAVQFKINGQVVGQVTRDRSFFYPLRSRLVTYTWRSPITLGPHPVLEVVIDPDNTLTESDETNNQASTEFEVASPDLEPGVPWLSLSPASPVAGESVTLHGVVRNSGPSPAHQVKVRFLSDGQPIGDASIASIPGSSGATASLNWRIPTGSQMGVTLWPNLSGTSGRVDMPAGLTRDVQVSMIIDPDEQITESDENNNTANPVTVTVSVPNEKKLVYVHVTDVLGPVPLARVQMTAANGESVETLTDGEGWCSFAGVVRGPYTLNVSKESYQSLTVTGETGAPSIYTRELVLERTADLAVLTQNDSDHDLLSDELESLYGTNPNDPDTDDDGVIDGKDLSPLINPSEPLFEALQKPGMVRVDQPICAYGLDGWCEVWDMDWSWSTMSDTLVYSRTYESNGTRASKMTQENYRKAVDALFASSGLASWAIKDIQPQDIACEDTEMVADHQPEDSCTYPADHLHRTEYRFYYDYMTDYQIVSLKNKAEILYPEDDWFFQYLLVQVQQLPSLTQSYRFQFTQPGLAREIRVNGPNSYRELGFQYAFYRNNQFSDDSNLPFFQGVVLVDTDGSDLFSFAITLPKEYAVVPSAYLKLTPVWVTRSSSVSVDISPAVLNWNLTGLVRDIVYLQDEEGNSIVGSDYATSLTDFGLPVRTLSQFRNLAHEPGAKTRTESIGFVSFNPDGPLGEKVRAVETQVNILSYVGKGIAGAGSGIAVLVEKVVTKVNKVEKVDQLPDTHWIKGTKYNGVLAGFQAVGGAVTAFSNGQDAYLAYQRGDAIECVYYTAKAVVSAGQTVHAMAKVSTNIVAWGGKTGRFAMLASEKVAVGLAAAVGVVEIGYNLAKWNATDDPIQKSAYFEKTFTSAIDTVLGMVGAVFAPHMLVFQVTWMVGNEIVFRLLGGSELAYEVAKSPSSAIVFIAEYWGEDVPSQLARRAYESVESRLLRQLEQINSVDLPFIPVFVSPSS